jgi:hypothetical protein
VQKAYLAGRLHLLPFPGSLIFWGALPFFKLRSELPMAMQIPLLNVCDRRERPRGLSIFQSGWLHEPRAGEPESEPMRDKLRNTYRRTHRWERVERYVDDLAVAGEKVRLAHLLFSTDPQAVGLYGKPMARNAQIWTDQYELLLDGPRAGREEIEQAARVLREGGKFGYRLYCAPMRVGKYEVFWHLPLVAFFHNVFRLIRFIWPVFSMLVILIMVLGLVTGIKERWTIGNSLYYAFITAFTIGYGDLAPKYPLTKLLSVVIGLIGFLFTGILVAIGVESMRYTITGRTPFNHRE